MNERPEQHEGHERQPEHGQPEAGSGQERQPDVDAERQEAHEALARDGPRIYVASLSDYNNGLLHGRWIEAVDDPEAMQQEIDGMLTTSPTTARFGDISEEWAIHDYDGFGQLRINEFESLSTIARLSGGIRTHGPAFAAWAAHIGGGERGEDLVEQFKDCYRGEWESVEAYAEELLDQFELDRIFEQVPDWLRPYITIDAAGFARDLQLGGDIVSAETPAGGVWVFGT